MSCTERVKKLVSVQALSNVLLTKTFLYRFIVFSALVYLSISNYYLSQKARLAPVSSSSSGAQTVLGKQVRVYKSEKEFSLQKILPVKYKALYKDGKCTNLVNWIVTTLSEEQTENNVGYLLKYASHSFCILVLASNSHTTPKWVRHKRVIYLTAKQLMSLPFELAKLSLISEHHFRNIGFLYAIQNGAQTLMDFDRFSVPVKMKTGKYLPLLTKPSVIKVPSIPETYSKKYWNPFISLGPKMLYKNRTCLPVIQVYTAASKDNSLLEVLSVPPSMYSSYSSYASVYLYESFWSLLLPQALEHASQWRNLLAHHHLHHLPGTCAAFTPPAIKLVGTSQKDSMAEINYSLVADILDSSPHRSFYKMSLYWSYVRLYEYGFVEKQDIDYSQAWLSDLKRLEYAFPLHKKQYNSWTSDVQLCIMFNLMKMTPSEITVNMILHYYLLFFSKILVLFDGEWPDRPKYIPSSVAFSGCKSENGKLQHICLFKCMQYSKKRALGYLYVADDMFVNLTMMSSLSPYKIWYINPATINYTSVINDEPTGWHWGHPDYYEYALKAVIDSLPTKWMNQLIETGGFPEYFSIRGIFDIIYVPEQYVNPLADVLSHIISTVDLFSELAGPLAVEIVAPQFERDTLIYGYLWHEKRTMSYIQETALRASFVHPVKLAKNGAEARLWQQLMDQQIFSLLGTVY